MTTQVGPNVPKVQVDQKTPPQAKAKDMGGCNRFWEIIKKYGSYIVSFPRGINRFIEIRENCKKKENPLKCVDAIPKCMKATIDTLGFGIILAPIDFIKWCIKQAKDDKKDPDKDKSSSTIDKGTPPAKDATPPAKDATPPVKDAIPAAKDATPPAKDATPAAKDAIPPDSTGGPETTSPKATPIVNGTDVPPKADGATPPPAVILTPQGVTVTPADEGV